jgi:DNA-binding PadR family transcriptional regulator
MTNAELAILSLVVEQPRYGYEIDQVIEERGMRDWTEIGFSSIYYLLKKLEQAGLIESQLQEAKHGPARRVYRATPAGGKALRAGTLDALSVPRRCYPHLQLGLANLPVISHTEAVAALQKYRDALGSRLAYVQERRTNQHPLPCFVEAMFEHSVALLKAELAWLEEFVTRLEKENEQDRL